MNCKKCNGNLKGSKYNSYAYRCVDCNELYDIDDLTKRYKLVIKNVTRPQIRDFIKEKEGVKNQEGHWEIIVVGDGKALAKEIMDKAYNIDRYSSIVIVRFSID